MMLLTIGRIRPARWHFARCESDDERYVLVDLALAYNFVRLRDRYRLGPMGYLCNPALL